MTRSGRKHPSTQSRQTESIPPSRRTRKPWPSSFLDVLFLSTAGGEDRTVTDATVPFDEPLEATSTTLLVRLKAKDEQAWRRFVYLYGPLIYSWCRWSGLRESDAADVGQEVFRTVFESIDHFHHDQKGDSFRAWLRTVTRTRVLDFQRRNSPTEIGSGDRAASIEAQETTEPGTDSAPDEEDPGPILLRRAVELILESCEEKTRQAFLRVVCGEEHPADVAQDLGMTANAVYLAKSHILRRIREEFAQLVDV